MTPLMRPVPVPPSDVVPSVGVPLVGAVSSLPAGRFLSEVECRALVARVRGFTRGGGETELFVRSHWAGNLRWARNGIISSGDVRTNELAVTRRIRGATGQSRTNTLDDRHLRWIAERAERGLELEPEVPDALRGEPPFREEFLRPKIWSDATYRQEAAQRAELMHDLVKPVEAAGMLSAGYLEVSATGQSLAQGEQLWYYPYTWARYTVTVRSPDGSGSGWAGVDHSDWGKIDAATLSAVALEKCLRSRNPVRLEPGRYTTILEPQAVGDFVQALFSPWALNRETAEQGVPAMRRSDPRYRKDPQGVYNDGPGYSKLGERVIDARLSITTDCTDPDLGFPPFDEESVYTPVTWIRDGVLTELVYDRQYAVQQLGQNTDGLHQYGLIIDRYRKAGAFRMNATGETTSVEEMIATTKRGLLVTRFYDVHFVRPESSGDPALTQNGYTRDGLWLIENGKLAKAVKNFRFTESPVFALNNVEQIGVPRRIYNEPQPGRYYPIVVPALKVRDFSFTAMSDAV